MLTFGQPMGRTCRKKWKSGSSSSVSKKVEEINGEGCLKRKIKGGKKGRIRTRNIQLMKLKLRMCEEISVLLFFSQCCP
jgi:hypothetical protein